MTSGYSILQRGALCAALLMLATPARAQKTSADDIGELRRAIEALQAENRVLAERLRALEGQGPAPATAASPLAIPPEARRGERLEQRVSDLESQRGAQESAVRSIIRDSISSRGSKINEAASLGGTLSVELGQQTDFDGKRTRQFGLGAVDFELDLSLNEWSSGRIKLEYVAGTGSTATAGAAGGTDRLTVDTAYVTLGNVNRFPAQLIAGRMVLPFGTSTGHPVADVLSLRSPLTVEGFEMRHDAVSLSWSWPTPPLKPPTAPVFAPPVQGRWLTPLVAQLGSGLGYTPLPATPKPLGPVSFSADPPPLHAGLYIFDGATPGRLRSHWGATAGFRTKGHCGQTYEQLRESWRCPWTLAVDLGYTSAIFNSRFLQVERADVLDKLGGVPGASISIKSSLGPYAFVGEWNGATRSSSLAAAGGRVLTQRPAAWQMSLGYQLGWHPWVQEIGTQGSYLAVGYSRTQGLNPIRPLVGAVSKSLAGLPRQRLLLTAGEWVQDGLRVAIEYAREWDYELAEGGTGRRSQGWTSSLTYAW